MNYRSFITVVIGLIVFSGIVSAFTPSGLLEIHYINVKTAGSTLVIGPDGTTMLLDAGNNSQGYADVVPYLQSIGITTTDELDYMIPSHLDGDHVGGLDEVIYSGYDVLEAVYYNGSSKWNTLIEDFFDAAATTTAGSPQVISLGLEIPLGDGATATCVAVHGDVLGYGQVSVSEENDKGIVLLIKYGEFEYIFGGDIGGGQSDNWCTNRYTATDYANIETPVATSLTSSSGANLLGEYGVEVLHVNHHGSESSTNSDYMNYLTPSVACINVGINQSDGWDFPRHDILDNVLRAEATDCVDAEPATVFQTEEGTGDDDIYRSYNGYCVGDIVIKTNGDVFFQVSGSGRLHGGDDEREAAGLPKYFPLDEDGDDDIAPDNITDLEATSGPDSGEVTLTWTAPGDDNSTGTAALYDIRYRLSIYGPIASTYAWNQATPIDYAPAPEVAGSAESVVITGLVDGESYYFAIKTMDDNTNESALSNSPMAVAEERAFIPGDANGDGMVLGGDVTYLINYFRGIGSAPDPYYAGDANGDCLLIGGDVTYLINYFRGIGPAPVDGNCE